MEGPRARYFAARPKHFSASGGVADFRDKRWKGRVRTMNSVKIVEEFWERVWKARNSAAIDDFVIEDFVITTGGVDVVSRTEFKEWAAAFMARSTIFNLRWLKRSRMRMGAELPQDGELPGRTTGY